MALSFRRILTHYRVFRLQFKTLRDLPSISFLRALLYFPIWIKKQSPQCSPLNDKMPWVHFDARRYIKKIISNKSIVFEFGAGGSTLFFLERAKKVYTVEHNYEWYNKVAALVNQDVEHSAKWVSVFVSPGEQLIKENSNEELMVLASEPDNYLSTDHSVLGKNFFGYASSIDMYDDNYFDIVFIDGRARPSCIKHSIQKVKENGFLILDNSDRAYYFEHTSKLLDKSGFRKIYNFVGPGPYGPVFWGTTIFQKKRN